MAATSSSSSSPLPNMIYFSAPQFFQRVYDKINVEPITYGLAPNGRAPRVPFIFHNYIPAEKKDPLLKMFEITISDDDDRRRHSLKQLIETYVRDNIERTGNKYKCRLDGKFFANEDLAISHFRDTYRNKIEDLLQFLVADLDQDHTGFMFTKLLYPDVVYPFYKPPSLSLEFPSSLAPELTPGKMSANAKKREKKKQKAAAAAAAAAAAPGAEKRRPLDFDLLRRPPKNIFTDDKLLEIEQMLYGVDRLAKAAAKQAAIVPAKVDEPSGKTKQSLGATSSKLDKGKNKGDASAKGQSTKPTSKDSSKEAKKAERERLEREKEQKRLFAGLLTKLEEEIWDEIEEDVAEGLISKLATRVYQEEKSASKQQRDDARGEEETQREAIREKKHQERKLRREMRIKEGERLAIEVEEEVIDKECQAIVKAIFDELKREKKAAEKAKRLSEQTLHQQHLQQSQRQSTYTIDPNAPSFFPASYSARAPTSYAHPAGIPPSLHTTSNQSVASQAGFPPGGRPPLSHIPPPTSNGTFPTPQRPQSPYGYPSTLFSPSHPQQASMFSGFHSPSAFTPSEVGGEPPFYSQYNPGNEFSENNLHQFTSSGNFSSQQTNDSMFTGPYAYFPPTSNGPLSSHAPPQSSATPPPRVVSPTPGGSGASSRGGTPSPTPEKGHPLSPRKRLSSTPEDVGMNSKRTVVCSGIPVYLANNEEISNFFKGCKLGLKSDTLGAKIHFLKPPDVGCCFVEFATESDYMRAQSYNGKMLRDSLIEVFKPTSGPSLSSSSSSSAAPGFQSFSKAPTPVQQQNNPVSSGSFVQQSRLPSLTRPLESSTLPNSMAGMGTWGTPSFYSLSSMLNTEQDTPLSADEMRRAKYARGAVGSGKQRASPEPPGFDSLSSLNGRGGGVNGEELGAPSLISPRGPSIVGPVGGNPLLSSHLFNPSPFDLGLAGMGRGVVDSPSPSPGPQNVGGGLKGSGLLADIYGGGDGLGGVGDSIYSLDSEEDGQYEDEDGEEEGDGGIGLEQRFYSSGLHDVLIDEEDEGEGDHMRLLNQFNFMDMTTDDDLLYPSSTSASSSSSSSAATSLPPGLASASASSQNHLHQHQLQLQQQQQRQLLLHQQQQLKLHQQQQLQQQQESRWLSGSYS